MMLVITVISVFEGLALFCGKYSVTSDKWMKPQEEESSDVAAGGK